VNWIPLGQEEPLVLISRITLSSSRTNDQAGFAMSRWIIWPCLFACFIVLRAKAADPPDQHLTDQQRMDEAYARLKARQAAAARAATQPAASAAGGPIEDTLQPQHAQLLAAEAALSTLAAENSIAATLAADDELEQRKLRISGSVSGSAVRTKVRRTQLAFWRASLRSSQDLAPMMRPSSFPRRRAFCESGRPTRKSPVRLVPMM